MGLGVGIFLLAIGAILTFAIGPTFAGGVNIHTIGLILMAVGALGLVLSLLFWSTWAGPGYWGRRRAYGPDGPPPPASYE